MNERRSLTSCAGVEVRVNLTPGRGQGPDLWPSVGEYPCYDAMLYQLMNLDEVRNNAYRAALMRVARNRRVLDIGTGRDLNWALLAARYGACQVTAVEGMPETAELAVHRLARSPLRGRVELVHAWSTDLSLSPPAEVCVSEIIGSIGGAEGAAAVVADARRRLVTSDAAFIPHRCVTMAGAIALREVFPKRALSVDSLPYLDKIFGNFGWPFDIRLGIANVGPEALVTDEGPVETLPFTGALEVAASEETALTVRRSAAIDGVLLWIQLQCAERDAPIDTLRQRTSWIPAYLPAFDEPVPVTAGDRVTVRLTRTLSDDGVHPDYDLDVRIDVAASSVAGGCSSPHHGRDFRSNALYRELFPQENDGS